jgi:hypothetical protein
LFQFDGDGFDQEQSKPAISSPAATPPLSEATNGTKFDLNPAKTMKLTVAKPAAASTKQTAAPTKTKEVADDDEDDEDDEDEEDGEEEEEEDGEDEEEEDGEDEEEAEESAEEEELGGPPPKRAKIDSPKKAVNGDTKKKEAVAAPAKKSEPVPSKTPTPTPATKKVTAEPASKTKAEASPVPKSAPAEKKTNEPAPETKKRAAPSRKKKKEDEEEEEDIEADAPPFPKREHNYVTSIYALKKTGKVYVRTNKSDPQMQEARDEYAVYYAAWKKQVEHYKANWPKAFAAHERKNGKVNMDEDARPASQRSRPKAKKPAATAANGKAKDDSLLCDDNFFICTDDTSKKIYEGRVLGALNDTQRLATELVKTLSGLAALFKTNKTSAAAPVANGNHRK